MFNIIELEFGNLSKVSSSEQPISAVTLINILVEKQEAE